MFTPRERPGTHCAGGWVGPTAGLDRCEKSRPPPGFDPQTIQLVASRYTDWATGPVLWVYLYIIQSHTQNTVTHSVWQTELILRWLQRTHASVYKRFPFELATEVFHCLNPNTGDSNIAIFREFHICKFWLRKISECSNIFRCVASSYRRSKRTVPSAQVASKQSRLGPMLTRLRVPQERCQIMGNTAIGGAILRGTGIWLTQPLYCYLPSSIIRGPFPIFISFPPFFHSFLVWVAIFFLLQLQTK